MYTIAHRHAIHIFCIAALLGVVLLACNGGPSFVTQESAAKKDRTLVSTNTGYTLTLHDLYHQVEGSQLLPSGGLLANERLQSFVDSVLIDTLLGLKAPQVNLRQHFDFYRIYRVRYLDEMTSAFFDQKLGTQSEADSQSTADYYHAHPEQFTLPEQIHVYTILITPYALANGKDSLVYKPLSAEQRIQKAYDYAMDIRAKITSPDSFSVIATHYSHAADAEASAGEVGWVARGTYLNPFDSVAFALKPGEISLPYLDRDGWHILLVTDRITAGLQPLEGEFYRQARTSVTMERVNTLGGKIVDSLKQDMNIQYNDSLMDADVYAVPAESWIAAINGSDTLFVSDLLDLEDNYRTHYQVTTSSPEMKKEMIAQLSIRPMVARAARQLGLDTLTDIREAQQFFMHANQKSVLRQAFDPPSYEPADTEIAQYYQAHKGEYLTDKPLVVQHIIASDSAFGLFLRDQAMSGIDFLSLAKEYYPGDAKVRVELADLGAIGESDVTPEFWQAALLTPEGGVSYPVKSANGYEVIKVIKHFQIRDEAAAASYIIPILRDQHAQQHIEAEKQKLYTEFGVRFFGKLPQFQLRPRGERLSDADSH